MKYKLTVDVTQEEMNYIMDYLSRGRDKTFTESLTPTLLSELHKQVKYEGSFIELSKKLSGFRNKRTNKGRVYYCKPIGYNGEY